MIIEGLLNWFMQFFGAFLAIILGMYPGVPDWFASGVMSLMQLLGWVDQLDHWVPVALAMSIAGAVLATWVIAMIIQIIRMIVSYLTLGGGAT